MAKGNKDMVKLITLDPGHFHAALVQKTMFDEISPVVHVYAPHGPDVADHIKRIESFNTRSESPTGWDEQLHISNDFFERMVAEKLGNVVVLAGNNRKKAEYIKGCAEAGLNVLSDKPMCIEVNDLPLLEQAFKIAQEKNVLIYDIMTERFEITSILQKLLANNKDVFGELQKGTPAKPAVEKQSVHHFFKFVSGTALKRPAWYFDTAQQGEGIVDVTTHLVDMVMWCCFPEKSIGIDEVNILTAKRWPTLITKEQFQKVTGEADFPAFLQPELNEDKILPCYANGELVYTLKGVTVKIGVQWNYQAPPGGADTHFSMLRGTKSNIVIRQGKEQGFKPQLYIEKASQTNKNELSDALKKAVADLQADYPKVELQKQGDIWQILIPDEHRTSHEAHFGLVMNKFLEYLAADSMPAWEIANMLTKYHTTIKALKLARNKQ